MGSRKRLSRNPAEPANPADLRMLGQVSRKSRSIIEFTLRQIRCEGFFMVGDLYQVSQSTVI